MRAQSQLHVVRAGRRERHPPPTTGQVDLDAVAVVVFAVAGRNAHDETSGAATVLTIAAPFLIGLLAGWLLDPRARARPMATATGVTVWLATAAIGLVLRRMVWDRGTAFSFVIVATVVLGVLLVGWRTIWAIAQRRRGLQSVSPPPKAGS